DIDLVIPETITEAQVDLGGNLVVEIKRDGQAVRVAVSGPLVVLMAEGRTATNGRLLRQDDLGVTSGREDIATRQPADVGRVWVELVVTEVEAELQFSVVITGHKIRRKQCRG